jgi:ATP-dependent Lon protease
VEAHETVPIVPLRDVVVFPHMMMPFVIGRPSSTRALKHALGTDKRIFLAAQHDAAVDDPQPPDIYPMGCVVKIVQSLRLPDGNIKVLVEGLERARAVEWKEDEGFLRVVVTVVPEQRDTSADLEATMGRLVPLFEQYIKLSNNLNYDAMVSAIRVDDPGKLADTIASHLLVGVDKKQNLLEIISPIDRLNHVARLIEIEIGTLSIERRIHDRVERQMNTVRAERYLGERKKAIEDEIEDLKKVAASETSPDVRAGAASDLARLEAMSKMLHRNVRVPDDFELPGMIPRPSKQRRRVQQMLQEMEQGRLESVESRETRTEPEMTQTAPGRWVFLIGGIIAGFLVAVLLWLLGSALR